jgi:hypothetical protein
VYKGRVSVRPTPDMTAPAAPTPEAAIDEDGIAFPPGNDGPRVRGAPPILINELADGDLPIPASLDVADMARDVPVKGSEYMDCEALDARGSTT